MVLFEFNQVTYKSILSIDHLVINQGEITAILGESGAGKTTLLHLMNKMISPTSGIVKFNGNALESLNSVHHRKKVILMSQNPYLFPHTILDNFKKVASIHNLDLDESSIKDLLNQVKIHKPLDTLVKTLSGGEAQRLALARIMVTNADVILLDEPSSALDDETERTIIDLIVKFAKSVHKTLIMVTHSKEIAKTFADRIYLFKDNKIKELNND
jgi:putative ABC transport system ATP-binding protein